MTRDEAIEKIKKLLNLSKAENASEAGTAGAFAQKLMEKFNIDELILNQSAEAPTDAPLTEKVVHEYDGPRIVAWGLNLASSLGRVNGCKIWYCNGWADARPGRIKGAGREVDLDTISYMMQYLCAEVERLCAKALRDYKSAGGSAGKTWTNSFKLGCVSTISSRLTEAQRQAREEMKNPEVAYQKALTDGDSEKLIELDSAPKYELAVINTALAKLDARINDAEKWAEEKHGKFRKGASRAGAKNYGAFSQGQVAGRSVSLSPARNHLT